MPDVRRYLEEFLMDPYVIDTPWLVRRAIVSLTVLPRRPAQSARAYASIWTARGAPLLVHSAALRAALSCEMDADVWLAMRYGEPSLAHTLAQMRAHGVTEVVLAPLYPQHADATRTTTIAAARHLIAAAGNWAQLRVLPQFHADPGYLAALAELTRAHIANCDHVLFSYHGLPERQIKKADPTGAHCLRAADCCECASAAHATCYRQQCRATTRALVQRLGLAEGGYSMTFQSRLGGTAWLRPYTDATLRVLPAQGVRKLAVVCPAFVADNLETLEEIAIQGRETFIAAGGESLHLVPCLNSDPAWVRALAQLLRAVPDALPDTIA